MRLVNIKSKIDKLHLKIDKYHKEIMKLQQECQHTYVTKKYRCNTGNYDPSQDSYWVEFSCPDCYKHWTKDSKEK